MSGTVIIGTSGYSYKDWVGTVYPAGTKREEYLRRYAELFSLVEINFSYYRNPDPHILSRIAEKTPEHFSMTVKGFRALTHDRGAGWKKEAETFSRGVRPVLERGKLSGILLQFPYSFHYTKRSRLYLASLCAELQEYPLLLEFRNDEWQRASVLEEMRNRNLGFVVTDYPDLPGLPRPAATATSRIGYVRLHGRNIETWWSGDNASRYDYLYTTEELREWIGKISDIAEITDNVMVVFNNHWRGKAVQNAVELRKLLTSGTDLDVR